jgi:predicted molibdopterin-dependent oxidoreductase YjgC
MTQDLFIRLPDDSQDDTVSFSFNGEPLTAAKGMSVAAALLANGKHVFRHTPVSGAPRAPYCMMGVCFECLLEIDGVQNRQSCMTSVAQGMHVHSQDGGKDLSGQLINSELEENAQ